MCVERAYVVGTLRMVDTQYVQCLRIVKIVERGVEQIEYSRFIFSGSNDKVDGVVRGSVNDIKRQHSSVSSGRKTLKPRFNIDEHRILNF